MRRGFNQTKLPDQSLATINGQTLIVQTAGRLPPKRRVHAVEFSLLLDLTQPGAAAAAQLGTVLSQLIAQLTQGPNYSITGLGMRVLAWLKTGGCISQPAGFPATLGGVFSRAVNWVLWYSDPRSASPNDGAVPSELWMDPAHYGDISLRLNTNAILAATAPTLGNALLRTTVYHSADSDASDNSRVVPTLKLVRSIDKQELSPSVQEKGALLYGAIFREAPNDPGGITSAQVVAATVYADGEPIRTDIRSVDLVREFNELVATSDVYNVESQTAPVPGSMINDQPGTAAAAGQAITHDFLPFAFSAFGQKFSQLPRMDRGFSLQLSGTLAAAGYKIVYEIIPMRPEEQTQILGTKLLGVSPKRWEPKTLSKKPTTVKALGQILPARVFR